MPHHSNAEMIQHKDAEPKRQKWAPRERSKEVEEEDKENSSLPLSGPPSLPPPPSPHLTDSPYNADQHYHPTHSTHAQEEEQDDDANNYNFTQHPDECKPSAHPEMPLPTNAHDHKQVNLESLCALHEVCSDMDQWLSLGPVDSWTATFHAAYDKAIVEGHGNTQATVDIFLKGIVEHVHQGKQLLAQLVRTNFLRLEKGDHLMVGDMQETLHHGVTILEAHLSLTAPSGPLSSDLLYKICAYKGCADDY